MFIRTRRRLSFLDLALVTIIGGIGGCYIWIPIFEKNRELQLQKLKETAENSPAESNSITPKST